jgi:general secretion pathway protein G
LPQTAATHADGHSGEVPTMLLATLQRTHRKAARRAGFTLLEVLVVVAILVILATVATVATTRYLETARKSKAQLQAANIAKAVDAFHTDPNNTGTQLQTLSDLAVSGAGYGTAYLKNGMEDLKNPWGGQFDVKFLPGRNGDGSDRYLIWTQSPDGTYITQFGVGNNSQYE